MEQVLENISSLLIQESDLVLGLQPYFETIDYQLRRESYDKEYRDNLIRNIEDAIRQLLLLSDNKCKAYALLRYCMFFVGGHQKDLFSVMLVMLLLDYFQLAQRLSRISDQLRERGTKLVRFSRRLTASFDINPEYTSNTIILGAITQCEALAAEHRFGPSVERQATQLCDIFNSFHNLLKDVEIEKLTKEQADWIDKVFDVCSSAYNVATFFLDSLHHKQKKKEVRAHLENLKSQKKLAKQLSQIRDHAQVIADRRPQLISTPVLACNSARSLTLACDSTQLDVASFDEDVDAIIAKLLVEDTRCITVSIVGVPGIGKKSIAKLIYNNDVVVHSFPLRLWVSGTTKMEIMKKILDVRSYLCNNKIIRMDVFADIKFFIVVDCSFAKDFWANMSHMFKDLFIGSRIIFTARKPEEAPPTSDTNFNCRLHLRSDDESWGLFMHTLKLNISSQLEDKMKKQILRKCGGLPQVIVNLAHLLSGREATPEEWSRVLEQLNQYEEPWFRILEEINAHVPLYLRRCLFYFGLFPADYDIPARRLINLWVAEGLVSGQAHGTDVEDGAEQCLEELTNFDMINVTERKLNGKIKTCRLPQAIRLHWIAKAKETNFIQGHHDITPAMRRLADHINPNDAIFQDIHGKGSTYMYPCYRDTVSFLSFDNREDAGKDIGNFLERCISKSCFFFLLVLDLETVYRPKFPKALSKLTHLRYLGLRWTFLDRLPMFINKLLSLQTLDLKGTCVDTLPASICKMERLRHLFLNQSFRTIFLPPLQESFLQDLKTLWGLFIDERSPVKNGLDKLQLIKNLGLKSRVSMESQKDAMSSQLEAVKNWVMNLKCLEKLRLKSFDELEQPWDLHLDSLSDHTDLSSVYLAGQLKNQQLVTTLPQNLIELTLSGSGLVDDPLQALNKLPNLKILRLYAKSYTGERMVCSSGGFPKLQIVKLWELEHLEAWDLEEGSLPQLKDLEIRRCKKLKMLPDGLNNIKTLRKIKLTQLPLVSPRVKDISGEDWIKIAHVLDKRIED